MINTCGNISIKMIRSVLRLISLTLGSVIGLFCGVIPGLQPAPLYGMPYADYKISGSAKSIDENLPIAGLAISIKDTGSTYILDSAYTDSQGNYSLEFSHAPWNATWTIRAQDVDGALNGAFGVKDSMVSVPESALKDGDGSWDKGHAEKIVDFKMVRID